MEHDIKFVRFERACGWNAEPNHARNKIYDWHVKIDGEHRCSLLSFLGRSYVLETPHGNPLYENDTDALYSYTGLRVETQKKFEPAIRKMLAAGRIPTIEKGLRMEDEREAK
jgi:hypothetical protein